MTMITRLSELLPELIERFRERGWEVERPREAFLRVNAAGEGYTIDGLERTGPVYWPHLKDWVERCGGDKGEGQLILLAMGFFAKEALGEFLNTGLNGRAALVELGLRSFFDEEPRPRKIGRTATEPFRIVEETLEAKGLTLQAITCEWCRQSPVAACAECGNLLCKSHFISCPLCGTKLCHPDVGDCYFKHRC